MDGSNANGLAARRLLVVTLAATALSLLWSAPAFAQSLISLPAGGAGLETTTGVSQAAAPVVQAAASVAQATTPAAQTTTPVVQQTAAPAVASAVPTMQGATQVAAPLVETATRAAAQVVQATAPVVQEAVTPILQAAAPLVQATAPVLDPVLETTAPVLDATAPVISGAAGGGVSTSAGSVAVPTSAGSSSDDATPLTTPDPNSLDAPAAAERPAPFVADRRGRGSQRERHLAPAVRPPVAGTTGADARLSADAPKDSNGTRATAPPPRRPGLPGSPTRRSSAATAVSGGGASILVAALAATLLLAVPGLSRRLRLRLAPRPLSILLPSLERPG